MLQIWYIGGGRILPAYEPQHDDLYGRRNFVTSYNWQNIKGEFQVY